MITHEFGLFEKIEAIESNILSIVRRAMLHHCSSIAAAAAMMQHSCSKSFGVRLAPCWFFEIIVNIHLSTRIRNKYFI